MRCKGTPSNPAIGGTSVSSSRGSAYLVNYLLIYLYIFISLPFTVNNGVREVKFYKCNKIIEAAEKENNHDCRRMRETSSLQAAGVKAWDLLT